jgi:prolyl-tRNA editing enzyme YbaK/EbsC (Cys-tRNA(Pro) deacylase)
MENHPNVIAVRDALESAGTSAEITILGEAVHTAPLAAAALGIEVGQIANSLIFDADGEPLLVLTSGAHRVDTAKVAALIGVGKLKRATPEFVRQHTGQAIGGVAPVGHPKPVRTLVDVDLGQYPQVWAAAGVPQSIFPITYPELVRVTDGTPATVA